jgi:RNA polymerase sigma factor for flagellar operon FliA
VPVLEFVAKRLAKRLGGHVHVDDLVSIGNQALLDVARTYDPSRSKFTTYAALKLKWAILDGLRREADAGLTALARAQALTASERFGEGFALDAEPADAEPATEEVYQARLRELLEGHAAALVLGLTSAVGDADAMAIEHPDPEETAAQTELKQALTVAVHGLRPRERVLIERYYFAGDSFEVIARDMGISKSWASRMHAQAIRRLGAALRGDEDAGEISDTPIEEDLSG